MDHPATATTKRASAGIVAFSLYHENPAFRFDADVTGGRVVFRPYPGLPAIVVCSNGTYTHQPDWYRSFLYTEERARVSTTWRIWRRRGSSAGT